MRSADNETRPADSAWKPAGPGHPVTFRCGICDKPKGTKGRRIKKVRGMRTWVCAGCVQ